MAIERVSNIFGYTAVELVFATIPNQVLELNVPLEINLNNYLPDGLIYSFGIKTGTVLPPNFAINIMTGIVMGTPLAVFTQDYNPIFTATANGITVESNIVAFTLEGANALWTDSVGNALWTDGSGNALWTGAI